MNIDELNSCFEAVSPTREQKDKILAGVLNVGKQPVKTIKFHRYATAAAAVFVIGVFAAVYFTGGTDDILIECGETTVAVEDSVNYTEDKAKPDEVAGIEENLPTVKNIQTKNESFADAVAEEYPEVSEELKDGNAEVAVENVTTDDFDATEAETDVEYTQTPMAVNEEQTTFAVGGGGGGGSSGGGSAARTSAEDVPSFSYNDDVEMYGEEFSAGYDCKYSPVEINGIRDAVNVAENVRSVEYDTVDVYYDNTTDIWKVVFSTAETEDSQNVYISGDGVIVLNIFGE